MFPGLCGFVLAAPAWQHLHSNIQDVVSGVTFSQPPEGSTNQKMTQQKSKPNYIQRANINVIKDIPRASRSGEETAPLKFTGPLPYKLTPQTQGVKTDQFKNQRQTSRVSQKIGRQRNNPQMKRKEESSERLLNEIETSELLDTEFKTIVIRKFNELSENYQNYREATRNLLQITPA